MIAQRVKIPFRIPFLDHFDAGARPSLNALSTDVLRYTEQNFQCNRRSGYHLIDIICFSFLVRPGMHSFLCSGAHFFVQLIKELSELFDK